jgi:hypothetical protein
MNERIKELADQADVLADNVIQTPGEYHPDYGRVWNEKFAELIVRECAKLVEENMDPQNAWITPRYIKEHFGVEE